MPPQAGAPAQSFRMDSFDQRLRSPCRARISALSVVLPMVRICAADYSRRRVLRVVHHNMIGKSVHLPTESTARGDRRESKCSNDPRVWPFLRFLFESLSRQRASAARRAQRERCSNVVVSSRASPPRRPFWRRSSGLTTSSAARAPFIANDLLYRLTASVGPGGCTRVSWRFTCSRPKRAISSGHSATISFKPSAWMINEIEVMPKFLLGGIVINFPDNPSGSPEIVSSVALGDSQCILALAQNLLKSIEVASRSDNVCGSDNRMRVGHASATGEYVKRPATL